MLRVLAIVSALFITGCSTLDSSSNFDDAIAAVNSKGKYKQVVAKTLSPESTTIKGSNLVDSKLTLIGSYSESDFKAPSSHIKLDITTFKSYSEYKTVRYQGELVEVNTYAPASETCSEHCTSKYYLSIPVENEILNNVDHSGLTFELESASKDSVFSFNIPKGYIDAVTSYFNQKVSVQKAKEAKISKPVEMVEYWYQESSAESQSRFTQWAFDNRIEVVEPFSTQSKEEEMMVYWFEKASVEERKQILSWLVVQ
ncbi:hypothetical protein [Vibrio sp. HN007]|uniref:hypothetical protein n=1 Tax=Vibrio iocasae TaxID=3098914 RepID=UPI0035D4B45C